MNVRHAGFEPASKEHGISYCLQLDPMLPYALPTEQKAGDGFTSSTEDYNVLPLPNQYSKTERYTS